MKSIQNQIRGASNLGVAFTYARSMPAAAYPDAVRSMRLNPRLRAGLRSVAHPESTGQLDMLAEGRPLPFTKELSWGLAFIASHGDIIRHHAQAAATLEEQIAFDKWMDASRTLSEHAAVLGESMWSLKTRLLVISHVEGLEAQKKYAASAGEGMWPAPFVSYVAHSVSIRNEQKVEPATFVLEMRSHLLRLEVEPRLRCYITYHVVPSLAVTAEAARAVLAFETVRSAVDLYEAILHACRVAYVRDLDLSTLTKPLRLLAHLAVDQRLNNVLFKLGVLPLSQTIMNVSAIDAAYRLYFSSNLSSPESKHHESILLTAGSAEVIADALYRTTESAGATNETVLLSDYAQSALSLSHSAPAVTGDVRKLFLNAAWARLPSWGEAFSLYHTMPSLFASANDEMKFALAIISPLSLTSIKTASTDEIGTISSQLLSINAGGVITDMVRLYATGDLSSHAVQEESVLAAATAKLRLGAYDDAVCLLGDACITSVQGKVSASRLKAAALLGGHQHAEAIKYVASILLQDGARRNVLPVSGVISCCADETRDAQLAWSVIVEFALRAGIVTDTTLRVDAYQDMLTFAGVRRPTEMLIGFEQYDRAQICFFLAEICVESVMDLTPQTFSTSTEVMEERQRLCHELMSLDAANGDRYQNELRALIKRLAIQRRIRQIEQSKVYVDLESIKRLAHATLRQSFERYREFLREGAERPAEAALKMSLAAVSTGGTTLVVPQNEVGQLFVSMLSALLDEFLWSSEHGLDWYLSVRIRHGTLEGQLRRPFEAARLMTRRDGLTGEYARNEYWVNRVAIDADDVANLVAVPLSLFSEAVDELIKEITTHWVQIRGAEAPAGLFEFQLRLGDLLEVVRKVDVATAFEEFVDIVLEQFRVQLAARLESVRARFLRESKRRISSIVGTLEASLACLEGVVDSSELDAEIRRAHTEMQVALDRVADWFKIGRAVEYEPFKIDEAIDVSVEMAKMVAPSFDVAVAMVGGERPSHHGSQFTSFVDIFFILFDNVIRHSGLRDAASVNVTINYAGGHMSVGVRSRLDRSVITPAAREKLARLRESLSVLSQSVHLAREGGTGFLKIGKILGHEFGAAPLSFDFEGDDEFVVKFAVDFRWRNNANTAS